MGVVYAPLAEDVYYATLVQRAMSERSLTLVTVPMAEYSWTVPASKYHTLGRLPLSAVYHRMTTPSHVNASGLARNLSANALGDWWRKRQQKVLPAAGPESKHGPRLFDPRP